MPYKRKEDLRRKDRQQQARRRQRVITLLGGRCAICKNSEIEVLQLDHIIPIRQDVKQRLTLRRLYRQILRGEYPISTLQILCANCHMKKSSGEHLII